MLRVKVLFALMFFAFCSAAFADDLSPQECDNSFWLNLNCPSKKSPDHACRYVAYMKRWGINPNDRSQRISKISDKDLGPFGNFPEPEQPLVNGYRVIVEHPKSYGNLAIEICDNYKKYQCAKFATALYGNDEKIKQKYFSASAGEAPILSKGTNSSIAVNLSFLIAENGRILKKLKSIAEYAKAKASDVQTLYELDAADRDIHSKFKSFKNELYSLDAKEKAIFRLMDEAIRELGLNSVVTIGGTAGFNCDYKEEFSMSKHNAFVEEVAITFNRIKNEIDVRGASRSKLVNLTYHKAKHFNLSSYSRKTGESIDKLIAQLNSDMQLDRLMQKYAEWWASSTVNGIANNLHTNYFFHSEPLRLIKTQKQNAFDTLEFLEANKNFDAEAVKISVAGIKENIATLDRNILFIESRGWKGLLNLQLAAAGKRSEAMKDSSVCQKSYNDFLQAAKQINDLNSFDKASSIYKISVETCRK